MFVQITLARGIKGVTTLIELRVASYYGWRVYYLSLLYDYSHKLVEELPFRGVMIVSRHFMLEEEM